MVRLCCFKQSLNGKDYVYSCQLVIITKRVQRVHMPEAFSTASYKTLIILLDVASFQLCTDCKNTDLLYEMQKKKEADFGARCKENGLVVNFRFLVTLDKVSKNSTTNKDLCNWMICKRLHLHKVMYSHRTLRN